MANPDPIVQKVIVEVSQTGGGGGGPSDPFDEIRKRIAKFVEDTKTFGEEQAKVFDGSIESIEKMRAAWAAMGDTGFDELNKKVADSVDSIKQPLIELDKALRATLDGSFTPEQMATVEKYFKTIDEGASFAAAKLGTGFEKLSQGTGDYVENLRILVGAVNEGAKAMDALHAANMENAITLAASNVEGFDKLQEDLAGALQKPGIAATESAKHILDYGKAASESVPPVEKLNETVQKTGEVINNVTEPAVIDIEKLKEALIAMGNGATLTGQQFQILTLYYGSLDGANDALKDGIDAALKELEKTGKVAEESAGGFDVLDKELKAGLDSIAHLSTAFRTMGIAMDRFGPLGQEIGTAFRVISGALAIVDTTVGRLGPSLETAIKTLEGLGPAGKTAAEGLRKVVDAIGDAIKGIPEGASAFTRLATVVRTGFVAAVEAAIAILGPWGLALAAIVAALAAVTTAIVYFGNQAIQAGARVRELAEATGQSVTELQRGEQAFHEMGIATEEYGKLSQKVAEIIAEMGPTLAKSMDESSNAVKQAQKAAQDATKTMLELQTGGRFRGAIGDDFTPQIKAQQQLQAIYKDQTDQKKKLAEATEAARQANDRAAEQEANNLRTITNLMKQAADGVKGIKFDPLVTETTKLEGAKAMLVEFHKEGKSAIDGITTALQTLSGVDARALAKQFDIPPEMLRNLREYGTGIKELHALLAQTVGVPITEEDNRRLEEAEKKTHALGDAWRHFMDTLKTPIFGSATAEADADIQSLAVRIIKALDEIVKQWFYNFKQIGLAIQELPEVMSAVMSRVKSIWFEAWAGMADAVGSLFSKLPGVFGRAGEAMQQTAGSWRQSAQQARSDWLKTLDDIQAAFDKANKTATTTGNSLANSATQSAEAVKKVVPEILTWGQALDHTGGDAQKAAQYLADLNKTGGQAGTQVAEGLQKPAPAADELNQKVTKLNETLTKLSDAKEIKINIDFDTIQTAFDKLVKQFVAAAEGIAKSFEEIKFTNLVKEIDSATESFKNMEQAAYAAAKAADAAGGGGGGGGGHSATETGGGGGFATGGLFRGRGGIDTNLAWLSDFEFVMSRAAVEKYGVTFMQLINAGRFASGGLVGGLSVASDIAQLGGSGGSGSDGADVNVVNTAIDDIGQTLDDFLHGMMRSLGQLTQDMIDKLRDVFSSINDTVVSMATALYKIAYDAGSKSGAKDQWQKDQEEFTKIAEQLQKDSGQGAPRRADGGLFRGKPGRDTNLAWLTDYEFVMRPEAVSKYGVAFMHMINALAFPFGGFASGGLVMPRMGIPAFRAGGINGGGGAMGRPLTLVLDGQSFTNLSGPAAVVDGLEKHATMSKASRIGRAPSWVK